MPHTPSPAPRRRRRALTCAVVAAGALTLVAAELPPAAPAGVGDRLFPHLGNPGYDVRSYDIGLRYGGDPARPLRARTVIDARVTSRTPMTRFHLDFTGGRVAGVRVGGRSAAYRRAGEDLVVRPRTPLLPGERMRVEVRHTSPTDGGADGGWVRTADGLAMANQADAAHRVFPGSDHPSDKARFTFRVTAPRGLTVASGGRLVRRTAVRGGTQWIYRQRHPMATELAQVSVGRSAVVRRKGPHGLPVRDVVPRERREQLEPWLARTPEQIAWMERHAGPYPFENYGLLVAEATTGFQLESQTLSLFERELFTSRDPDWRKESVMVHELAHQWFGNSVTPRRWDDLWLGEGHATWYEWHYGHRRGGPSPEQRARQAYRESDEWRRLQGPPARLRKEGADGKLGIFRDIVYEGSALVLFALREEIGPDAFARLQREWPARYRDGNASTADFVRLAGEVSGRDLSGFLHPWLYGRKTPPMPGHPQWRTGKTA